MPLGGADGLDSSPASMSLSATPAAPDGPEVAPAVGRLRADPHVTARALLVSSVCENTELAFSSSSCMAALFIRQIQALDLSISLRSVSASTSIVPSLVVLPTDRRSTTLALIPSIKLLTADCYRKGPAPPAGRSSTTPRF